MKLVGAVLLSIGIGTATLAGLMIERGFAFHRTLTIGDVVLISSFAAVAAFCLVVGYRFLVNRPNRHESALSPTTWRILAVVFWVVGLVLAVATPVRGDFGSLAALATFGLLGYCCTRIGRGASRSSISAIVFPPETSLLALGGFAPPGFVCGIEILNDKLTPMQFVVLQLRDTMSIPEADAIRIMLDVHQNGGVLLPTSTPEEARKIADAITSAARLGHHPLVCRAVGKSSIHDPVSPDPLI